MPLGSFVCGFVMCWVGFAGDCVDGCVLFGGGLFGFVVGCWV